MNFPKQSIWSLATLVFLQLGLVACAADVASSSSGGGGHDNGTTAGSGAGNDSTSGGPSNGVHPTSDPVGPSGGVWNANDGQLPITNLIDEPNLVSALSDPEGYIKGNCSTEKLVITKLQWTGGQVKQGDSLLIRVYRVAPMPDGSGNVAVTPSGVLQQSPPGSPNFAGQGTYSDDCKSGDWNFHPSAWLLIVEKNGVTIDILGLNKCIQKDSTEYIESGDVQVSYIDVSAGC